MLVPKPSANAIDGLTSNCASAVTADDSMRLIIATTPANVVPGAEIAPHVSINATACP